MSKNAHMIPADAYPQMVSKGQAQLFSQRLRSSVTEVKAVRILEDSAEGLREAVLVYAAELEAAGQDLALISEKAHEIKGFADTAGLHACARLCEGLCRYMEESDNLSAPPDTMVLALYISAIVRAARAGDMEAQMCAAVAGELANLAARKLAAVKSHKPD